MERSPRPSHRRNNSSFSSCLLDAIDRSIVESDSPIRSRFDSPPSDVQNPSMRTKHELSDITSNNHSHCRQLSMSTVTSHTSSFGGFSSDAESPIITYRQKAIRLENSRSSTPPPPPPEKKKKRSELISIRSKIRELRTSGRGSLARFLKTLFSGARKPKVFSLTSGDARDDDSMWSSSSCCTRSSIGRITPSGQRSGGSEFWAHKKAKIVKLGGEEQELSLPSPLPFTQTKTVKFEQSNSMVENGARDSKAKRRMVEEMLRRVGEMEEDGWESDSSEDLFEIENLIRVGREGEYSDELPVFGTTNFETNRAIARGFVM